MLSKAQDSPQFLHLSYLPDSLIDDHTNCVLCDVVDASSPTVVAFVGHAFLDPSITL